ncbi:voltage-dependent R-type calcium channel subunit alpha-1E [Platysternon megacephalum]|uniref:Voltage-dependent R-type calcium channel subunit alpha-1E n=1 Tax=Platysternon megacephalum TaxID=55544 RepID=A0A4D9E476_9SAUR|nr:voltage-dependent R-type calcium channel subunit alpha-1E [Platysternon megacephalum]
MSLNLASNYTNNFSPMEKKNHIIKVTWMKNKLTSLHIPMPLELLCIGLKDENKAIQCTILQLLRSSFCNLDVKFYEPLGPQTVCKIGVHRLLFRVDLLYS